MKRSAQNLAAGLAWLTLGACSVLGAPSRVRAGELYVPGSAKYDAYFADVHAQQVSAASWTEERRGGRKPLLDALRLVPDADDATIEQATKDKLSSGVLRLDVQGTDVRVVEASSAPHDASHDVIAALEQAAHAEIARASKLAEVPAHVDSLAKTGHELEGHIAEDFAGDGQRPFDVKEELHASYDVLQAIADGAVRERRSAEAFVAELGRAVSTGTEVPPVTPAARPRPAPSQKPARPAPKPQPPPHGPEPVAAAPKPAPPPAPKPAAKAETSEVFSP